MYLKVKQYPSRSESTQIERIGCKPVTGFSEIR